MFLWACDAVDVSELSDEDLARISEKAIVCDPPYMRLGTGCCLDRDENKICDADEATECLRDDDCDRNEVCTLGTCEEKNTLDVAITDVHVIPGTAEDSFKVDRVSVRVVNGLPSDTTVRGTIYYYRRASDAFAQIDRGTTRAVEIEGGSTVTVVWEVPEPISLPIDGEYTLKVIVTDGDGTEYTASARFDTEPPRCNVDEECTDGRACIGGRCRCNHECEFYDWGGTLTPDYRCDVTTNTIYRCAEVGVCRAWTEEHTCSPGTRCTVYGRDRVAAQPYNCYPEPECVRDSDCESMEECSAGKCEEIALSGSFDIRITAVHVIPGGGEDTFKVDAFTVRFENGLATTKTVAGTVWYYKRASDDFTQFDRGTTPAVTIAPGEVVVRTLDVPKPISLPIDGEYTLKVVFKDATGFTITHTKPFDSQW